MDGRARPRAAGRRPLNVERLADGLWTWTAAGAVSVYYEAPDAVVLIDPRVPEPDDEQRFWRALDRDVARLGLPVALLFTADETADAGRFRARYATTDALPDGVRDLGGAFHLVEPDATVTGAPTRVATAPR